MIEYNVKTGVPDGVLLILNPMNFDTTEDMNIFIEKMNELYKKHSCTSNNMDFEDMKD